jgi:glycosyltransferase involved in cell wall biosynthesis
MIDISVAIPAYNAEPYLAKAIESVRNQKVTVKEIVLIDDGSKDATEQIAKNFGVKVFNNPANMGIGYSRQKATENCSGDYIAFLSVDDSYHKDFLEITQNYLDEKSIIFTDYYRCINGKVKDIFNAPTYKTQSEFRKLVIDWALRKNMFTNFSTVIIPRRVFSEVSFDTELRHSEDLIFLLDTVIKQIPWVHIQKPLCYYSFRSTRQNRTEWELLWKKLIPRLTELGVSTEISLAAREKNFKACFDFYTRAKNKILRNLGWKSASDN